MGTPNAEALLTGQLATALEELKTKSEEPLRITDIHAIKARSSRMRCGWRSELLGYEDLQTDPTVDM